MSACSLRLFFLTGTVAMCAAVAHAKPALVFVTSFAPGDQGAIHALQLDRAHGTLTRLQRTGGVENPFFIALTPDRRFLYSIHAPTFGGPQTEFVAAFRLEGVSGQLTPLNRVSSRGTASCYLEVDATGKSLLLANYASGSVASFAIGADGSLSEAVSFVQHAGSSVNPTRQKEAHAHCFVISPNNRHAFAADLGTDQIASHKLDAVAAKLQPNVQPFVRTLPGAGPRHLTFHPNGRWLYVINELLNSVTRFDYSPESGMLIERQTIPTLPADFTGTSHCADVKITPNGSFLYGTNRGHDSVAAYRIADDGELKLLEIVPSHGQGPQNLAITADGRFLLCANMPGNNLTVFQIGAEGTLQPVSEPLEITGPSCIRILD